MNLFACLLIIHTSISYRVSHPYGVVFLATWWMLAWYFGLCQLVREVCGSLVAKCSPMFTSVSVTMSVFVASKHAAVRNKTVRPLSVTQNTSGCVLQWACGWPNVFSDSSSINLNDYYWKQNVCLFLRHKIKSVNISTQKINEYRNHVQHSGLHLPRITDTRVHTCLLSDQWFPTNTGKEQRRSQTDRTYLFLNLLGFVFSWL